MSITTDQVLEVARGHYRDGRYAQAQTACEQLLAEHPDQADALHVLGRVMRQKGQPDIAVDLIGLAIDEKPDLVDAH
jgi:tetratricopeptide (TPR) repeat protein